MDIGLAVGAAVLLAIVAFRRRRRVLTPEARRAVARQSIRTRSRQAATTALTITRAAIGIAALIGIVWLTRELFT